MGEWLIQHHWERLKAGEEGDNRWDGWMASPTQWTWVWTNSRSCDRQGGLACCSPCSCKELDTTEQLNWTTSLWNLVEKMGISSGHSFCRFITKSYIPGYQVSADSWFFYLNASVWHHLRAGLITSPPPRSSSRIQNPFPQKAQGHLWPTSRSSLALDDLPRPTDVPFQWYSPGKPIAIIKYLRITYHGLRPGEEKYESDTVAVLKD